MSARQYCHDSAVIDRHVANEDRADAKSEAAGSFDAELAEGFKQSLQGDGFVPVVKTRKGVDRIEYRTAEECLSDIHRDRPAVQDAYTALMSSEQARAYRELAAAAFAELNGHDVSRLLELEA